MNQRETFGPLILRLLIAFVLLIFIFIYVDPLNAMQVEAEMLNIIVFGVFLPLMFTGITIVGCLLLSLPLRLIQKVDAWWKSIAIWQLVGLCLGVLLLILSKQSFLRHDGFYVVANEKQPTTFANEYISLSGWFLTAFFLLNIYPTSVFNSIKELFSKTRKPNS